MIYDIKAIPTRYAGVNFRSRLEARWAAFFDLCGWKWEYEPFDLEGWCPDFLLKGKRRALIEVKPIEFDGSDNALIRQAKSYAKKAFDTARRFRWPEEFGIPYSHANQNLPYEVLIIGNGPFRSDGWCSDWTLGVLALEGWQSEDIADLFFGNEPRLFDYAARYGSYQYRVGGEYDGDGHLCPIRSDAPMSIWREAGNAVQWKKAA